LLKSKKKSDNNK